MLDGRGVGGPVAEEELELVESVVGGVLEIESAISELVLGECVDEVAPCLLAIADCLDNLTRSRLTIVSVSSLSILKMT